jgi:predicted N-acetyltransferase YhbS
MPDMRFERCSPGHRSQALSLANDVFVVNRKRSRSLVHSFPNVFAPDADADLFVARSGDAIVATVLIRRFKWAWQGRIMNAAMLGWVCTVPEVRGQGIASDLLQHIQTTLRSDRLDFAVLWTTIPEFYARLGWQGDDASCVLTLGRQSVESGASVELIDQSRHHARLDCLRSCAEGYVLRSPQDYLAIPPAVDEVRCCAIKGLDRDVRAYTLFGRCSECAWIYEAHGAHEEIARMAAFIAATAAEVRVNTNPADAAYTAFSSLTLGEPQPQRQTMWLPLSASLPCCLRNWYVPVLDRI